MHVASVVVSCPPCADSGVFGFVEVVGNRKCQAEFVAHGFDFIEGPHGCGDDLRAEFVELIEFFLVTN